MRGLARVQQTLTRVGETPGIAKDARAVSYACTQARPGLWVVERWEGIDFNRSIVIVSEI